MTSCLTSKLHQHKKLKQEQGLYRDRRVNNLRLQMYNFSCNDYLSLSTDTNIKKAYQDGFDKYPTGSSGSIVVSGYHQSHRDLEKYFSEILNVDDCLLFSSGYCANLSVVSMLAQQDARLLLDKSVHASIYDGIKLSGAKYCRYNHNDLTSLSRQVNSAKSEDEPSVVITESIFSMSGQVAPLLDISKLISLESIDLVVDEAHAFGVLGPEGLGGVLAAGLSQTDVPLRVIPFGKAIGASGAIVAGQRVWIEALLQMRPSVYSTAISPAYAHGILKTIENIRKLDERRRKLADLVEYFRSLIKKSPLKWRDSVTQIQQLQLGCPYLATKMAEKLQSHSIICLPIRQPTVSKDQTGLRVILNYEHEPEHIDFLFDCLHLS
jgi:8-amino-7-oxononanoate synthase